MTQGPTRAIRQLRFGRAARPGQAIVWAAVMLPLLLSVVGLAIDGGIVFAARRDLQDVADAAARAGAIQVDVRAVRESGGETIVLDAAVARQVASEYVASQGSGSVATITADQRRVVVRLDREVPTGFLRLVGLKKVAISAVAPAEARYGIERGNR
jgi:Flp pilus assembly protein TadG